MYCFDRVRNRRELHASLKGATLGDAEDDVDDTLKWIKRNKKKEKELAKKRQQELENRDKEIQEDYTERGLLFCCLEKSESYRSLLGDLVGLKVSHDFDELDEGEAKILTLKDSRILDNEGKILFDIQKVCKLNVCPAEDELQNVEMAEEERLKERLDLKIKKRAYTGYDDDEFKEGNQGLMKRSILAKYDEELEGPRHSVSPVTCIILLFSPAFRNSDWEVRPSERKHNRKNKNCRLLPPSINLF